MTRITVTDHACLRFIERVMGVDVERVRAEIAGRVRPAAEAGASSITIDGACFCLVENVPGEVRVATTLTPTMLAKKTNRYQRKRF